MKTRKWIPVILLAISLSSFQKQGITQTKDNSFQQADGSNNTCSMSVMTSMSKDDVDYSRKLGYYRFTFCPDGNLTIVNSYNGFTMTGSYVLDDKLGTAKIFVNSAAAESIYDFNWLNGEWQILDQTDNSLEMDKIDYSSDTKPYYRVKFEERMATYK